MKITDLEPYRPHIDKFDLTEEQKPELVNVIIKIAEVVLDRRFGFMDLIEEKSTSCLRFPLST